MTLFTGMATVGI